MTATVMPSSTRLLRPRRVYCPVEHAHRDRVIADDVCAGRFTHLGLSRVLGVEPNWLGASLPDDPEWRIEWSKFYYGLDLADAYTDTGEDRYRVAWERVVTSWIDQVPPGHDRSDIIGRRVQNWIYAWMLFADAPSFEGLSDGAAERIAGSIRDQVVHLRDHLTPERNHRTLELYALFVASLAMPSCDSSGTLAEFALAELHRNLVTDVLPDGVHRERSTHYHMVALRSYVGTRENARRFGMLVPPGYDDRLARACEFAAHLHRPDGRIVAFSDSDGGSYRDVLSLAAELLDRPDLLFVATGGERGTAPGRAHATFPIGGYCVQRSGWGASPVAFADARYLAFDCGPLGDGGHGHYDALSIEVAAGGRPLVVDPGRFTYAEPNAPDAEPNWRRWFKGTAAHNTVCVDGRDQTRYARGKPNVASARARLLARHTAPGLDVLAGEAESAEYEARHRRHIIFVAGEYWVIIDRLEGIRPHRYDLRFHLAADAHGRTMVQQAAGSAVVRTPGLALVCVGSETPAIEPGWIAPRYGVKEPAPVVSVVSEGVPGATFVTIVVPLAEFASPPPVRVLKAPDQDGVSLIVGAVGQTRAVQDRIDWNATGFGSSSAPAEDVTRLTWTRTTALGDPIVSRTVTLDFLPHAEDV